MKKLTKKQREWINSYEHQTGFQAMYLDDFRRGVIPFRQVVKGNLRWLEGHCQEVRESHEALAKELFGECFLYEPIHDFKVKR